MAKTVVGLFDDLQDAQAVVRELEIMGLRREDISVVTKADTAGLPDGRQNIVASGTTKGAEAGAVIGGLAGLLIGLAPIALPGIGVIL
ncbi:MAG TPA: general stress protein, partial [Chthonomonadaceae bacterium]|nr:general stress protein [Chthonomonadaceae bacterium]